MEILFHLDYWSRKMALVHDFFVIADLNDLVDIHNQLDFNKLRQCRHISINDDIIIFISKTLKWFMSENYTKTKTIEGLFYYGISLIEYDNLNIFLKIIILWKELFELAPERNIILQFDYDKKYILQQIEVLIELLEYAIENDRIVLHCGI